MIIAIFSVNASVSEAGRGRASESRTELGGLGEYTSVGGAPIEPMHSIGVLALSWAPIEFTSWVRQGHLGHKSAGDACERERVPAFLPDQ